MAVPLSVRVPESLRERVAELAAAERRSLGAQVVVLLEEAMASRNGSLTEGDAAVLGRVDSPSVSAPSVSVPKAKRTKLDPRCWNIKTHKWLASGESCPSCGGTA